MRSSATIKVMTVLLSLFVLVMVTYQVYYHFNEKRDTVEAELYTYNDNITARGVFVRDESVITYSGNTFINSGEAPSEELIAEIKKNNTLTTDGVTKDLGAVIVAIGTFDIKK